MAEKAGGVFTIIPLNEKLIVESGQGWGGAGVSNICRPNNSKSCAACCGLYNVTDASEESLTIELRRRSSIFDKVPRHVNELVNFKEFIASSGNLFRFDPDIHVCEFIGFLDLQELTVGCMLHPCSSGNNGVDLRGLCHYGAMACKSFYCPSWTELSQRIKDIVAYTAPDWRTYGLLVTDVTFSFSITRLIELQMGHELSLAMLKSPLLQQKLSNIMLLKDNWPMAAGITLRRSNYYFRSASQGCTESDLLEHALTSLSFTYDQNYCRQDCKDLVRARIDDFVKGVSERSHP